MSQKCYLEVYSKHNELKDFKKVEYWDKYIKLIDPILSDMKEPINSTALSKKINELLPEFKDEYYPVRYHSKVGEDYFVYNNQISFKYNIPDTFLMPFKKGQERFSYNTDFELMDDLFSGCHLEYKTTVREGLPLMEKRMEFLKDSNFKTGCEQVVKFLKDMPLDSILVLNSGDIYIEDSPQYVLDEISRIDEMFLNMDNKINYMEA